MLSYNRLKQLVEQGVIRGLDSMDQINGTSIDVRLGNKFLIERMNVAQVIDLKDRSTKLLTQVTKLEDYHYLDVRPGQFLLAHTMEEFHLPNSITAVFQLKSSIARSGLGHLLAGFCDPGWNDSVLTLELKNETQYHSIRLWAGLPIGQMIFFEHEEVPAQFGYAIRGRYNHDKSVSGMKQ